MTARYSITAILLILSACAAPAAAPLAAGAGTATAAATGTTVGTVVAADVLLTSTAVGGVVALKTAADATSDVASVTQDVPTTSGDDNCTQHFERCLDRAPHTMQEILCAGCYQTCQEVGAWPDSFWFGPVGIVDCRYDSW
jgi:hypothetical protein